MLIGQRTVRPAKYSFRVDSGWVSMQQDFQRKQRTFLHQLLEVCLLCDTNVLVSRPITLITMMYFHCAEVLCIESYDESWKSKTYLGAHHHCYPPKLALS